MPAPLTKRVAGALWSDAQSGRATVADCEVIVPASSMAWAWAAAGRSAARSRTKRFIRGPRAGGTYGEWRHPVYGSLRGAVQGHGKPRRRRGLQAGDRPGEEGFEPAGGFARDLLDLVVGERVGRDPGPV